MFSNTSSSGWAGVVFQAKFVLEGVLLPVVGSVGILGKWEVYWGSRQNRKPGVIWKSRGGG